LLDPYNTVMEKMKNCSIGCGKAHIGHTWAEWWPGGLICTRCFVEGPKSILNGKRIDPHLVVGRDPLLVTSAFDGDDWPVTAIWDSNTLL